MYHGLRSNNTSGYTGISRSGSKWRACYKGKYLGSFDNRCHAFMARIEFKAAQRYPKTL